MKIPVVVSFKVNLEEGKYEPILIIQNACNFNAIPCKPRRGVAFGFRSDQWEEGMIVFSTGILVKTKEGFIEEIDFDDNWVRKIKIGKPFYLKKYVWHREENSYEY